MRFDIFITFWPSFLCSLYRVFQQDQIPPYRILSQGVSRAASQPHTSHKLVSSDRSCRAISENRRSRLCARRRWRAARADSAGPCVSREEKMRHVCPTRIREHPGAVKREGDRVAVGRGLFVLFRYRKERIPYI